MTSCVVFDFDGVLVDSNAVKRRAYSDIFSAFGPGGEFAVESVLRGDTEGDRYGVIRAILCALPGSPVAQEELGRLVTEYADRYNSICEEYAATCGEVAGASETLGRLAPDHSLYVISATPQDPLRRIVMRRGWTGYFRDVLGRPATKQQNLVRVMRQEGVGGEQIVLVGDGRRDLEAARDAGCRFVAVRNEFNDFDTADLTMIEDLRGLPDLIRSGVGARAASKAG